MSYHQKRLNYIAFSFYLIWNVSVVNIHTEKQQYKPLTFQKKETNFIPTRENIDEIIEQQQRTIPEAYSLTSVKAIRLVKTLVLLNIITATSLSCMFPEAFEIQNQHWRQR